MAEGATKPASDIAVSTIDEPVKRVATVLTISDELTEAGVQVQAYLNSRLSMFVRLEEERQLLRDAGTNKLVGIFGRSGIHTYSKLAADDNATALATVIANTAGSAFLQPDTVILHPTNWLPTRQLRDGTSGTEGRFYGGGPFTGVYGNSGAVDVGTSGRRSGTPACSCRTTSAQTRCSSGTSPTQRRSPAAVAPTVEVSNQH